MATVHYRGRELTVGTYQSVLAAIQQGRPIPAVAEALDRREDAIRGMVRSMVREGYLRELGCEGEACSGCPMADSCGLAVDGPSSYVVTRAGLAHLEKGDEKDPVPMDPTKAGGDPVLPVLSSNES